MHRATAGRQHRRSVLGAGAILGGMVFFFLSVGWVDSGLTVGQASAPWPDGAEYLDASVSWVREGAFGIHLAGETHPSRYPPGFSVLLAGAMILGSDPATAAHRTNFVAGLVLLTLPAAWLWRRSPLEAGLTVLLLATLPAFVILARSPLSEVSGTVVALWAVWLLYGFSGDGSLRKAGLGALFLGLGVAFRTSNVLLLVFLPAAALARFRRGTGVDRRETLALLVGTVLGLAPICAYNHLTFGSPLVTGYGYWASYWDASRAFGWEFVAPNLLHLWQELSQSEVRPNTASLYGQGSYFGPAFVLLALVAPFGISAGRRFWYFAAAALAYFSALATYFYSDARLLFPLFVMAAPVAAKGVVGLWRRQRVPALAVAALLLTTLLGWPARGGVPETLTYLPGASIRSPSPAYLVTRQLQRLHDASPRLVLAEMPPPYIHAVSAAGTIAAPLFDDHLYRFTPESFVFKRPERHRLVEKSLLAGRSVWAITHRRDILSVAASVAAPEGYAWEVVSSGQNAGGIARLVVR